MTLYDQLIAAGCRTGSHYSDLYVKADEFSRAIIKAAQADGRLVTRPTLFRSEDPADDGSMWYEIAFGYSPFWRKKGLS